MPYVYQPSGWFVDNNLEGQVVVHEDGADGLVLAYDPINPDVALIQWADNDQAQWVGADIIRKNL